MKWGMLHGGLVMVGRALGSVVRDGLPCDGAMGIIGMAATETGEWVTMAA
jgi:hypothetical protein